MHFQNIHTFTYQKTLLHTLFCLFLKSSKAFCVSLKQLRDADVLIFIGIAFQITAPKYLIEFLPLNSVLTKGILVMVSLRKYNFCSNSTIIRIIAISYENDSQFF